MLTDRRILYFNLITRRCLWDMKIANLTNIQPDNLSVHFTSRERPKMFGKKPGSWLTLPVRRTVVCLSQDTQQALMLKLTACQAQHNKMKSEASLLRGKSHEGEWYQRLVRHVPAAMHLATARMDCTRSTGIRPGILVFLTFFLSCSFDPQPIQGFWPLEVCQVQHQAMCQHSWTISPLEIQTKTPSLLGSNRCRSNSRLLASHRYACPGNLWTNLGHRSIAERKKPSKLPSQRSVAMCRKSTPRQQALHPHRPSRSKQQQTEPNPLSTLSPLGCW